MRGAFLLPMRIAGLHSDEIPSDSFIALTDEGIASSGDYGTGG